MRSEDGFTLIELLVVVALIGILAAIGVVVFARQVDKAHDVEAKQLVGNLVRQVEACDVDAQDVRECDEPQRFEALGLRLGDGPGEVELRDVERRSYVAVGHSATGAEFRMHRSSSGRVRSCAPPGEGGCHAGAVW